MPPSSEGACDSLRELAKIVVLLSPFYSSLWRPDLTSTDNHTWYPRIWQPPQTAAKLPYWSGSQPNGNARSNLQGFSVCFALLTLWHVPQLQDARELNATDSIKHGHASVLADAEPHCPVCPGDSLPQAHPQQSFCRVVLGSPFGMPHRQRTSLLADTGPICNFALWPFSTTGLPSALNS